MNTLFKKKLGNPNFRVQKALRNTWFRLKESQDICDEKLDLLRRNNDMIIRCSESRIHNEMCKNRVFETRFVFVMMVKLRLAYSIKI